MTVSVVTDSAAALPVDLQRELGVTVVPILLTVDGEEVADDALSPAELLAAGTLSTAAPGPGAFARAVAECPRGDGVLILTVSAKLSSCHRAAVMGAREAGRRTIVVDTANAAGGQALAVHAAVSAAGRGAPLEEVAAAARRVAARVRLMGVLGGLDQLVRSGRIPAAAGRAGDRLGVRPLFDLHDGRIRRLLPSRSTAGAHRRILEQMRQSRPAEVHALHVAAVHADAHHDARSLLAAVEAESEPATAFVGGFGGALVAAAGVGVSGLAWWWEPPPYRHG
ncbi:MAG: DegV family EDD domain-containing protein [bacterium]|nr:DegV family EDD domain-containing protein [bacterium]